MFNYDTAYFYIKKYDVIWWSNKFRLTLHIKKIAFMDQLTKREEEVMNKFWEKGEATVKEIIATYPEPRPSRTAISTFVKFLVDKGFLGHKPAGNNGFIYYPLIEREEYCGNNLNNVVQQYFNNSIRGVISTLVRDRKMSDDEVRDLINQVIEGNRQNEDQ